MKMKWEEPSVAVQKFVPNEYVAACVTGTIACAIPGDSAYAINDGTKARTFNYDVWWRASLFWTGEHWDSADNLDHGICGETTSISFDSGDGTGYEMNHGVLDTTRTIYGISGYELNEGTYNVIWMSQQAGNPNVYKHYGTLKITNIDNDHPNRS